jgi:hypothetical protein
VVARLLILASALCCGSPVASAFADWLHAQAIVESDYVFVGEPFTVKIRALGTVRPRRPDTSVVKDFIVEFGREEWNPSRGDTVFTYRFRARRAGTLHIPPIPVRGAGAAGATARVTIRSRPLEETDARLQLRLPATECYTGQRLLAHLEFRFRGKARNFRFDASFIEDDRLTTVLPTGGFVHRPPDGYLRVRLNRLDVLARVERAGKGDGIRNILRVPMVLVPRQAGLLRLEAPGVRAQLVRVRGRKPQNLYVMAELAELNVRELPEEGRPDDFSGLVGDYDLRASLDGGRVRVGDPLQLTLTLTGQPYLYDLELPESSAVSALTDNFQVRRATPPATARESAKDFHYVIRPRHAGVTAVPSIVYNSFDPGAGRYIVRATDPLPLQVDENDVITAADAEGLGSGRRAQDRRHEDTAGGIAHNFEDSGAVLPQGSGLGATLLTPLRVAGFTVPPAVFLGALAWRRLRKARGR